jgi:REP element-mobilizing transposase RayT
VMPNHWHFVVKPKTKHQVTRFFRWLTNTHPTAQGPTKKTTLSCVPFRENLRCVPFREN